MESESTLSKKLLEKKIEIHFQNEEILEEALTHKSLSIEKGGIPFDNERLEFLGDSILNMIVTEHLYKRFQKENEGKLSKLKSQLVSRSTLAEWGKELKVGSFLRLSENEQLSGGRKRDSLLANAMEALIGAIFLDQGFEKVREFVAPYFEKKKRIVEKDYKSKFQEIIQKKYKVPPSYSVLSESGPDHSKIFHIEARVKKKIFGEGKGKSKKEAEQSAAKNALKKLKESKDDESREE